MIDRSGCRIVNWPIIYLHFDASKTIRQSTNEIINNHVEIVIRFDIQLALDFHSMIILVWQSTDLPEQNKCSIFFVFLSFRSCVPNRKWDCTTLSTIETTD